MYLIKTPKFIQNLFPGFIWKIQTEEKVIHLTFDDGPIPEITPWVVNLLDQFNAKATFFCVGDNIVKHPDVFRKIRDNGHTVGNHTYNHLNGWNSENIDYYHNIRHCANIIDSPIFRPPYGKLKPKQVQFLLRHYKIIMWDVLSGDFDQEVSNEQCVKNVINNARAGSIVVFHDSLKAMNNLKYTLPIVLEHFTELGYRFENLSALTEAKPQLSLSGIS